MVSRTRTYYCFLLTLSFLCRGKNGKISILSFFQQVKLSFLCLITYVNNVTEFNWSKFNINVKTVKAK